MTTYYVNKNAKTNGVREIHAGKCNHLPSVEDRVLIGYFKTCDEAVKEALELYPKINRCSLCITACHKEVYVNTKNVRLRNNI